MIVVADFYRINDEHVPVNAGLLCIISKQYATQQVHFYAEERHCEAIKIFWSSNELHINNVVFQKHSVKSRSNQGIKMVLSRIMFELKAVRKLSGSIKKEKGSLVFFLSLSSVISIFLKLSFFKKITTVITLHGDVEFIRLNNDFTRNFLGRCFRISFRMKRALCKYLVLDEVIKRNLLKGNYLSEQEIIAIQHPYIFKYRQKEIEYSAPFRIGHIGVASTEKRSYYLFRLAKRFEHAIAQNQFEFLLIGRNENIDKNELNELVSGAHNKEMLAREDFEHEISTLHYAVFFHDDIYQLTGSGTILDAFNFEKPVIALKNELFNAIFERAGKIGFLCSDIDEMELILQNIISGNVEQSAYKNMQYNMKLFKEKNSLEKIQYNLFSQLDALTI